MTAWGAAEWGAVATAAAGFMALVAAWWTVQATRQAAAENSRLLKEQIKIQSDELSELRAATLETNRRDKLHAAYTIFKLIAEVQAPLRHAAYNAQGSPVIVHFPPDLIKKVEDAYPLQSYLNRDNHILFQVMDALVHGEAVNDAQHAGALVTKLDEFRRALTPAIVGLPKGGGSRLYGVGPNGALHAGETADI